MKKLKVMGIISILIYLMFAFILNEFNTFVWGIEKRGIFIFVILAVNCLSIPVMNIIELENKPKT
jgi:hypothetical protein